MWKLSILIATIVGMTVMPSLVSAEEKREAKPRFKGVEMYSWKDKDGNWIFVLLDGTNRQKTEMEVRENKDVVKGVDAIRKALALLAEGEQVFWGSHRLTGFEFPKHEVRKEIEKAAVEAKIILTTNLDDEKKIAPLKVEKGDEVMAAFGPAEAKTTAEIVTAMEKDRGMGAKVTMAEYCSDGQKLFVAWNNPIPRWAECHVSIYALDEKKSVWVRKEARAFRHIIRVSVEFGENVIIRSPMGGKVILTYPAEEPKLKPATPEQKPTEGGKSKASKSHTDE